MTTLTSIHIVASDTVASGRVTKLVLDAGYHTEIYASPDEIARAAPKNGICLIEGGEEGAQFDQVLECLQSAGQWLPIVVFDEAPRVPSAVRVIKLGAMDYVKSPLNQADLRLLVDQVAPDVQMQRERHQFVLSAQCKISKLSPREGQVLEYLAAGYSNKMIARALDISPRTIEIHRMKMKDKLGVKSVVDAVRLWIAADSLTSSCATGTLPDPA